MSGYDFKFAKSDNIYNKGIRLWGLWQNYGVGNLSTQTIEYFLNSITGLDTRSAESGVLAQKAYTQLTTLLATANGNDIALITGNYTPSDAAEVKKNNVVFGDNAVIIGGANGIHGTTSIAAGAIAFLKIDTPVKLGKDTRIDPETIYKCLFKNGVYNLSTQGNYYKRIIHTVFQSCVNNKTNGLVEGSFFYSTFYNSNYTSTQIYSYYSNSIISGGTYVVVSSTTFHRATIFDTTNPVTFIIDGVNYGTITDITTLRNAMVTEYGGSASDYFQECQFLAVGFKNASKGVLIPTHANCLTGAHDTEYTNVHPGLEQLQYKPYFGAYNPLQTEIQIKASPTSNSKFVNGSIQNMTIANEEIIYSGTGTGEIISTIIKFAKPKRIDNILAILTNDYTNKYYFRSQKQVIESEVLFAALVDGEDYYCINAVTISGTAYAAGSIYRFATGNTLDSGTDGFYLIQESRLTFECRFSSVYGTIMNNTATLNVGSWMIVIQGTVTYNSVTYTKGQSFEVVTGVTSFTGTGLLSEIFTDETNDVSTFRHYGYEHYSDEQELFVTTTDDAVLAADWSNIDKTQGQNGAYAAVNAGTKTRREIYAMFAQIKVKAITDLI